MSFNLNLPKITDVSQVQDYLYQLVEQLNWALNSIDTQNTQNVIVQNEGGQLSEEEAVSTFSSIKELIIKSADIVEAYSESIGREMQGRYVLVSDFGTFSQETSQRINESELNITQNFTNLQTVIQENTEALESQIRDNASEFAEGIDNLTSGLNEISRAWIDVNAYVETGLIDYDENDVPIYGMQVGQRTVVDGVETFNKYARFTANRLSFYDQNGSEVAYISDYKLYITAAEFNGSLRLNDYMVSLEDGIAFVWAPNPGSILFANMLTWEEAEALSWAEAQKYIWG